MGTVRVGISGWTYDGWRGDFYPEGLPRRRELEHAARVFPTIEINGSFYGLQKPSSYRRWGETTPRGFRFAVKGSRFITHNKKLRDAEMPLANFFASGLLALGPKLGPILWQLPPSARFDAERLEGFFELLPKHTREAEGLARRHDDRVAGEDALTEAPGDHRLRHALEVRHESFFDPEAVRILRRHGVALVVSDSADWPLAEEPTAGFMYLRLHGSQRTYASRYTDEEIDRWAEKVAAWHAGGEPESAARITDRVPPHRKGRDVWVYFDNDHKAQAPRDACRLIERLEERGATRAGLPAARRPGSAPARA